MPSAVVVSQPMFLPWSGLFEQVRLADVFVHYDDVQRPQGRSFTNRVQVKTQNGPAWMTAPIDGTRSGKAINETMLVAGSAWRRKQLATLRHNYARAPHCDAMMELAERIYAIPEENLARFNESAIEEIARWLGLRTRFLRSSELGIPGRSTERLVEICRSLGATDYVTGLGALKYLEHDRFEAHGIAVRYMDYRKQEYRQLHGEFTPFVTILDPIANCGRAASDILLSETVHWKQVSIQQP